MKHCISNNNSARSRLNFLALFFLFLIISPVLASSLFRQRRYEPVQSIYPDICVSDYYKVQEVQIAGATQTLLILAQAHSNEVRPSESSFLGLLTGVTEANGTLSKIVNVTDLCVRHFINEERGIFFKESVLFGNKTECGPLLSANVECLGWDNRTLDAEFSNFYDREYSAISGPLLACLTIEELYKNFFKQFGLTSLCDQKIDEKVMHLRLGMEGRLSSQLSKEARAMLSAFLKELNLTQERRGRSISYRDILKMQCGPGGEVLQRQAAVLVKADTLKKAHEPSVRKNILDALKLGLVSFPLVALYAGSDHLLENGALAEYYQRAFAELKVNYVVYHLRNYTGSGLTNPNYTIFSLPANKMGEAAMLQTWRAAIPNAYVLGGALIVSLLVAFWWISRCFKAKNPLCCGRSSPHSKAH